MFILDDDRQELQEAAADAARSILGETLKDDDENECVGSPICESWVKQGWVEPTPEELEVGLGYLIMS